MIRVVAWLLLTLASALTLSAQLCVQHVVSPGYPRLARIAQVQGRVTVIVNVDESGKILSVRASSGPKLLIDATEENLRQWIFCPDSKSSGPLAIIYTYALEGKPQYEDGPATVVFDMPGNVRITARPYEPQPHSDRSSSRDARTTHGQ